MVTEYTSFKLNFGKNPWKGDLIVKTELPRLEDFFEGLQKSWEVAKKSMKMAKEAIKKQFDKKTKFTRINRRRQCVAESQKYPFELILKEVGLEKIQIFYNLKKHQTKNISTRTNRSIGNSQCI